MAHGANSKLVAEFDLDSYLFVFQLCKEAMLLPEYRQSSLASGIEIAINGCFERKELYVSVVIEYLKEDTPVILMQTAFYESFLHYASNIR